MKSPRGSPRNFDDSSPPPQAGAAVAAPVDLLAFQKQRSEGLVKFGKLTQDVIQSINSTLKNAIAAGQTKARVQTLFLSQHYCYSRATPPHKSSLVIHDDNTLEPMDNCQTRIVLAERARELVEWLQEQGIHYICTALCVQKNRVFGEPVLAPYLYIVAVFVPSMEKLIWNTVYVNKDLNATSVWQTRTVNALRVGASHVVLGVLFFGMDFTLPSPALRAGEGGEGAATPLARSASGVAEVDASTPRASTASPARSAGEAVAVGSVVLHPTLKPASYSISIKSRFKPLIEWITQQSFTWTCAMDDSSDPPKWAYLLMNLTPIKYLQ